MITLPNCREKPATNMYPPPIGDRDSIFRPEIADRTVGDWGKSRYRVTYVRQAF
jgi:hypothetical protein